MAKPKNPASVKLVPLRYSKIPAWDIKTREGAITIGDVRKYPQEGTNQYLACLPAVRIGWFRTRATAVAAVVAAAQAEVAEAQP